MIQAKIIAFSNLENRGNTVRVRFPENENFWNFKLISYIFYPIILKLNSVVLGLIRNFRSFENFKLGLLNCFTTFQSNNSILECLIFHTNHF